MSINRVNCKSPAGRSIPGRRGVLLTLLLVLAACSGSEITGVGGEGTGSSANRVIGRLDGFGSLVIAGVTLDESGAELAVEVDPRAPASAPLTELRLGMNPNVELNGVGRAGKVLVAPELRARLAEVDPIARELEIAQQVVLVDAVPADPTTFEGFRDLSELDAGEMIEVFGQRDSAGRIRASHIARRPAADSVRVMGTVRGLDAVARTFTVGNLGVRYTRASVSGPVLAEGQRVAVYGTMQTYDPWLEAVAVAVQEPPLAEGTELRVQGLVTDFASAGRLSLRAIPVDASAAVIEGGSAAELGNDRLATVVGVARGGVLRASTLTLTPDGAAPSTEIVGAIADFVSDSIFSVRGTTVDASRAVFQNLGRDNLANGVRVRVSGRLAGAVLLASSVRIEPVLQGELQTSVGVVVAPDLSSGRFFIGGLADRLRLDAAAVFVGATRAEFVEGVRVRLRGRAAGAEVIVTDVEYVGTPGPIELSGLSDSVFGSAAHGTFRAGPVELSWNAQTVFLGSTNTFEDMGDGRLIRVLAQPVGGGRLLATTVDARNTQPGVARLRGTVGPFVSLAEFHIEDVEIDGSTAVFEPAGLATRLVGAMVEVEGSLNGGVLRATRVVER